MHSETPLISVRGLSRRFPGGETEVTQVRFVKIAGFVLTIPAAQPGQRTGDLL